MHKNQNMSQNAKYLGGTPQKSLTNDMHVNECKYYQQFRTVIV